MVTTRRLIPWTTRVCGTALLLATLAGTLAAQDGQQIPLGARFAGELSAGQADAFLFEAVVGTQVTVRVKGKQGLRPKLTLEDALTSEPLAEAAGGKSVAIVKFVLSQTGHYRVRIEGTAAGPSGPYGGRGKGKPPTEAKQQSLKPKDNAANALLTFPAVAGARLTGVVRRLDGGDGTANWITLVGPDGEVDLSAAISASNDGQRLKIAATALPALGNYVLTADVDPSALKLKLTEKPPLPVKGTVAVDPPAVQAVLGIDTAIGTSPLEVAFADGSLGPEVTRSWDFGDGNGSTSNSPTHVYTEVGTHTVHLAVAGADGVLQSAEALVEVLAGVPPLEPPPVADFDADVTVGLAPLEVSFQDLSTGAFDAWSWDFGDDEVAVESDPVHTYTAPGVYTVRLTVNGEGGPHSLTRTAFVTIAGVADAVVADFSAAPTTGNPPLPVSFTDLSTGPVLNRSWDFGDGVQSDLENPVHVYTAPGIYTVTYTVEGAATSDVETRFDYVVIEDVVPVGLSYTQDIHPIWATQPGKCTGCHGNDGGLRLNGTPEVIYQNVLDVVKLAQPASSKILTEPAGVSNHGGGQNWAGGTNDPRYQMVLAWIEQGAQGP